MPPLKHHDMSILLAPKNERTWRKQTRGNIGPLENRERSANISVEERGEQHKWLHIQQFLLFLFSEPIIATSEQSFNFLFIFFLVFGPAFICIGWTPLTLSCQLCDQINTEF